MDNNIFNEQDLYRFFEQDSKNTEPNQSIKPRLLYFFRAKSSTYKIRQNSFTGLFSWFFNLKNFPVKAAIASLIIVFSFIDFGDNSSLPRQSFIDSTINNNQLYIDSAMLLPFNSDTCYQRF